MKSVLSTVLRYLAWWWFTAATLIIVGAIIVTLDESWKESIKIFAPLTAMYGGSVLCTTLVPYIGKKAKKFGITISTITLTVSATLWTIDSIKTATPSASITDIIWIIGIITMMALFVTSTFAIVVARIIRD